MISVLLSNADSGEDLAKAWDQWIERYGKPPAIILAHEDLPFSNHQDVSHDDEASTTTFRGVSVIDLDTFIDLHEDDLTATRTVAPSQSRSR